MRRGLGRWRRYIRGNRVMRRSWRIARCEVGKLTVVGMTGSRCTTTDFQRFASVEEMQQGMDIFTE